MGKRQEFLQEVIYRIYQPFAHPKPSRDAFKKSAYWDEIVQVYQQLSGTLQEPPIRFGPWDISTKYFIIELDEERHFNRYRLQTLQSKSYQQEKNFSVNNYMAYCQKYEPECLKTASWGKNWKNASTEKLFALSNGEGDLTMGGSSRWKQRAYNDFLRDASSHLINIPIFRISIYDSSHGTSANEILEKKQKAELTALIQNTVNG